MRPLALATLALAALLPPLHYAQAQYPGRNRDRNAFTREDSPRAHTNPAIAPGAVGSDPYSSLERELISLKGDLKLQPQQAAAWEPFERAVRAAAEVNRSERRRLFALRDAHPAPTAEALLGELARDARDEADAAAAVRTELQALQEKLDPAQRATLDRRVIQSQVQPLGR